MPHDKEYLGDSVYVHTDGLALVLTTENGLPTDPSNLIFLESEVYEALLRYVERPRARQLDAQQQQHKGE